MIVVVDDDPAVRRAVARMVQRLSLEVETAEGGPAALGLLQLAAHRVEAVLTDVDMPGMSGFDLALEVLQRFPAVRVLLMSGRAANTLPPALGGAPWLAKPFSPDDLRQALRTLGLV